MGGSRVGWNIFLNPNGWQNAKRNTKLVNSEEKLLGFLYRWWESWFLNSTFRRLYNFSMQNFTRMLKVMKNFTPEPWNYYYFLKFPQVRRFKCPTCLVFFFLKSRWFWIFYVLSTYFEWAFLPIKIHEKNPFWKTKTDRIQKLFKGIGISL